MHKCRMIVALMVIIFLQRQGRRCMTIVNMKKDIHPKYYEEAKVRLSSKYAFAIC